MTWLYAGVPYENCDKQYEGFIYLIINSINGRKYIGKKSFWSRRKQKNGRRKTFESDWKTYFSSSDELKEEVAEIGSENFQRIILRLCKTKKEMSFHEQKEQWDNKVLESDEYYNTNIGGKYFVHENKIYFSEKEQKSIETKNNNWRALHSENMKKLWANLTEDERKQKSENSRIYMTRYWEEYRNGLRPVRPCTRGMKRSEETKRKISESRVDMVTDEYRKKISIKQRERFSTGIYHTPFGSFRTCAEARESGINIQKQTINKYCKQNELTITSKMVSNSKLLKREWIGKTLREVGFWFEKNPTSL